MSTSETKLNTEAQATPVAAPTVKIAAKKSESPLDKILGLLSSVRFGLVMLGLLLSCCIIGMIVMQVNVEGFQKYYHQTITPAQRLIFGALGFFDIYHARYFTLFLAITGLNIILASIDRFPAAWQYVIKPKLTASPKFIAAQMFVSESEAREKPQAMAEQVRAAWRKLGFRARISEENNRITVFAQRSVWNRLGAYVVHVALLTIFTGGFLTNRYGLGGSMEIRPGKSSNQFITIRDDFTGPVEGAAKLPFDIECRDIQQKLIRPEGGLEAQNTIDWLSSITIKDGDVRKDLLVHLNNVGDYRGYRFFQSQFLPIGNAREIKVSFEPINGGQPIVSPSIPRNGSVDVPGVGNVRYVEFFADFEITESGFATVSRDYNKPVAQLEITSPSGQKQVALALGPQAATELLGRADDKAQKDGVDNKLLVNGNKVLLKDFEKVSYTHTLTIQYDPGRVPVYIGFTLLVLALSGVFFFSHQRVWAVIEPDDKGSRVYVGGNTNRNRPAFEARFNSLVQSVTGGGSNK
jgi:cytochrome c biogenesis protein